MIIHLSINRVAEENEDQEELQNLPFGCTSIAASFRWDPKTGKRWKYLYTLQKIILKMFKDEIIKEEQYQKKGNNNE